MDRRRTRRRGVAIECRRRGRLRSSLGLPLRRNFALPGQPWARLSSGEDHREPRHWALLVSRATLGPRLILSERPERQHRCGSKQSFARAAASSKTSSWTGALYRRQMCNACWTHRDLDSSACWERSLMRCYCGIWSQNMKARHPTTRLSSASGPANSNCLRENLRADAG